ncbi:c-type cytochrome [Pseudomonadota bacterium]
MTNQHHFWITVFSLEDETMAIAKVCKNVLFIFLFVSLNPVAATAAPPSTQQLFKRHCLMCHAMDKDRRGPSVNSMSSDAKTLRDVIANGKRPMRGYKQKLTSGEIDALVDYILSNNGG